MKNSFILFFGLGFVSLICSGYGSRLEQNLGLDPEDVGDLKHILAKYANEISLDFGDMKRYRESEISRNPDDVHFYLYSNDLVKQPFYEIPYNNCNEKALEVPIIMPNKPWKFLIHGFTQAQNSSFPQVVVNEYIKSKSLTGKEYNIVVVDWGQLAYSLDSTWLPIYFKAVQNVAVAGKRVGEMIVCLNKLAMRNIETGESTTALDLSMTHVIGFSLGAHVAGEAGNYVRNTISQLVGRMTGLDPAGPQFYLGIAGRQLSVNDAATMDIIHTSWNGYGIGKEIGKSNFYPNGPKTNLAVQVQPWCLSHFKLPAVVCSHNLAPIFYALSINHPHSMDACTCGGWLNIKLFCSCNDKDAMANMGEDWTPNQQGSFYLDISSKELDERMSALKSIRKLKQKYLHWNEGGNQSPNSLG